LPRVSFREVDLVGQDLRRINLHGAIFKDANLLRTDLREADLRDVDFTGVQGGLQPQQLAGADLTGATLPEPLTKLFDELKAVGDISESARKLFLAMLVACLYSWLTIATTTDVNLITNRASSPLPIIQTSIPIVGFYVVAPLLLLCVYFYFHFYLQKLWEELGTLPAVFPDGRRLHERSDPWLLNDLVRSHVWRLKADRPFMSYFQQFISVVLAWWLVPITLFFFWGRYLPRHDFYWTTLQVVLLAISIVGAVSLYHLAGSTLRGAERRSFSWGALTELRTYAAIGSFVAAGVVLMLLSIGAIRGVPPRQSPWWTNQPAGRWGWVPRAMAPFDYSPFANLRDADLSEKPSNWTGNADKELDLVKGAAISQCTPGKPCRVPDLRYADASGAFLAKANLEGAWLEGANLRFSDLRQARLTGARLTSAFLTEADLSGAHLRWIRLIGAELSHAGLKGADLDGANLNRAHLNEAVLTGADLSGANLDGARLMAKLNGANLMGAHLIEAHLDEADLNGAQLGGAHLNGATLAGANLSSAHLNRADLNRANLVGADLSGADLTATDLTGAYFGLADLRFADFRSETSSGTTTRVTAGQLKTAHNRDKAYYDDDLLKVLFPTTWRDHNQKLAEEQKREEQNKSQPPAGAASSPGHPSGAAGKKPADAP
jgi:uncharacterized protein YjbI with pentapeptide repeats